jgi:hypothetical protein
VISRFRVARLIVLIMTLVAVSVWAAKVEHRRISRTQWERQVRVSVVLLVGGATLVATAPALLREIVLGARGAIAASVHAMGVLP